MFPRAAVYNFWQIAKRMHILILFNLLVVIIHKTMANGIAVESSNQHSENNKGGYGLMFCDKRHGRKFKRQKAKFKGINKNAKVPYVSCLN